jgi:hypothetical protein
MASDCSAAACCSAYMTFLLQQRMEANSCHQIYFDTSNHVTPGISGSSADLAYLGHCICKAVRQNVIRPGAKLHWQLLCGAGIDVKLVLCLRFCCN